jgi:ribonuclease P protein component
MLKKKYRLKKYSAFKATYKIRNIIADENLCIYFGKEKTSDEYTTKIAFVVSKKIHKRAVVRNRIKRLMRESFRLILKENKFNFIHNYISIICVAKTSSINTDFSMVNNLITKLLAQKSNKS